MKHVGFIGVGSMVAIDEQASFASLLAALPSVWE
jgi:hypothetical protein